MEIQRMLSNGRWSDEDRNEHFINLATEAKQKTRDGWEVLDRQRIIERLKNGREVRCGTDWYMMIRRKRGPRRRTEPVETRCDCGHYTAHPMNASLGTSCPDCYDRMSG